MLFNTKTCMMLCVQYAHVQCSLIYYLQGIGFTLQDPDTLDPLQINYTNLTRSKDYWLFSGNRMYHNGNKQEVSISTFSLKKGESIGCCITRNGDLEIYINGQKNAVGWHNVPVDKPLWGVADIYGKAKTIQSEFHCGELYWYNDCSGLHSYACAYIHVHIHVILQSCDMMIINNL